MAAGLASWMHAVALAGANAAIPEGDAAHYRAMALEMLAGAARADLSSVLSLATSLVPNPGILAAWLALVQGLCGIGERAAVAAWLPFHLLLAAGLWRGGNAVGGRVGGAFAVVAGLASPVIVHAARSSMFDFPLVGCVAFAVGGLLDGGFVAAGVATGMALWTRLAGGPLLAVPLVDTVIRARRTPRRLWPLVGIPVAFVMVLYPWHAAEVVAYAQAGGNVPEALRGGAGLGGRLAMYVDAAFVVAQPPVLIGLVVALLSGGGLRMLGWAVGMVLALLPLTVNPQARYLLPVVPVLVLAVASMAPRWSRVLPILALTTVAQTVAYDLNVSGAVVGQSDWRRTPPSTPEFPIDAALDWLVDAAESANSASAGGAAGGAAGGVTVAVHVEDWPGISFAALRYRALERGLNLRLIAVDESRPLRQPVALALVLRRSPQTARAAWLTSLPPPSKTLACPDGFTLALIAGAIPPE